MVEFGHPDFGKTIPCVCQAEAMAQRKKERLMAYCQLPDDTEDMTFDKFEVRPGLKDAFEASKAMARGDLHWLTLLSKVDRGKTHLAVAICRERLSQGEPAKYIYVPLLLDELRDGYNNEAYRPRFQQFLDVPLLVMDDLGVQKATDWANEKLNTIIDYRYINGKELVVTTNKELDQLPGDDEYRIASRLQRVKKSKVVVIDAPEFRIWRENKA